MKKTAPFKSIGFYNEQIRKAIMLKEKLEAAIRVWGEYGDCVSQYCLMVNRVFQTFDNCLRIHTKTMKYEFGDNGSISSIRSFVLAIYNDKNVLRNSSISATTLRDEVIELTNTLKSMKKWDSEKVFTRDVESMIDMKLYYNIRKVSDLSKDVFKDVEDMSRDLRGGVTSCELVIKESKGALKRKGLLWELEKSAAQFQGDYVSCCRTPTVESEIEDAGIFDLSIKSRTSEIANFIVTAISAGLRRPGISFAMSFLLDNPNYSTRIGGRFLLVPALLSFECNEKIMIDTGNFVILHNKAGERIM